ncbi:uncharacterized protein Z518_09956 [Rhinocladiella mackenziei CBS 650.93]|uniref:AMP-activated protein kinase glycogen-binding domain-containing protein n=1 Tax=Rhinocladiella mackenziei CBS 650.93 TaxID=1442369 RepID=A0A0D2ICB0_9EURO|nr:uncharacterized protein Z518_09956 [Rhinocladiella mackenziei CBS 650.93]KIX00891.1 hypothetical protein Z518_09956 [Rhinocladiella mackenziei CBS 650.93]
MGSFVFRWPHPDAADVHVTGTFDDWGKTESLNKVGDVWEKEVELSQIDKKILYKFVVNDKWVIDPTAPQEDDGHGNVNNVLHPDQIKPKAAIVPEAVTTSSAAPDSTTAAMAGQVPLEPKKEATEVTPTSDSTLNEETTKSSLPGAFPETPMKEPDSFGVNPLPATSGAGNPVDIPAGEKLPPPSEVTSNTIDSTVTTSKEDYEKAGGSSIPIVGGTLAGAAGLMGFSSDKKEKENLIPESSLPMGDQATEALDAGPMISSAAPASTTAEMAGQVPLEEKKAATVVDPQTTTETVPEVVKESIAEAHTSPEATTSPEVVKEKAEVEQELLKKVPENDEEGKPAPSATVPETTTPGEAPTATVSTEKTEGDNTEYAPPQTTSTVPEESTLAGEPAVQMMNKNEAEATGATTAPAPAATTSTEGTAAAATTEAPKAEAPTTAAPESKKEPAETPATTSATSTPTKKPATTPTSSPASDTKEKKKHRISSLFKKILK